MIKTTKDIIIIQYEDLQELNIKTNIMIVLDTLVLAGILILILTR